MISLLSISGGKYTNEIGKNNMDELMLGDALKNVIQDKSVREIFFSVISKPLINKDDILYRQAVLSDILSNRAAFEILRRLFLKLIAFVSEYNTTKSTATKYQRSGNGVSLVETGVAALQPAALLLARLLSTIKKLGSCFDGVNFKSSGLSALENRLLRISKSESLSDLSRIASQFENFYPAETAFDVSFLLDAGARIRNIDYLYKSEANSLSYSRSDTSRHGIFKSKSKPKPSDEDINSVCLNSNTYSVEKLISSAISGITDSIIDVSNCILSEFSSIAYELDFYEGACLFCDKLDETGIKYSFPDFGVSTDISSLYDIYLLFRARKASEVIPNDFALPRGCGGILIHGDNGSGKTVFLRSVNVAYILAQSGLAIPAERAVINPSNGFFIQMASSENTLDYSDDTGRFEEEVKTISSFVKSIVPGSLVSLNEVFQTTAYDEGADGLYYILKYFSAHSVSFLCVTHLRKLSDLFSCDCNTVKIRISSHKAIIEKQQV